MKVRLKVRKQDLAVTADQLGMSYVKAREALKASTVARNAVADRIKTIAAEYGEAEGPRKVLTGTKYVVGFTTTSAAKKVDWERFKRKRPTLFAQLSSRQIDEKKVEAALADGTLPRELLEKFVIPAGDPVDRLLCEEVGKESNEAEADMD